MKMKSRNFLSDPMTHFSYTVQGYRDIVSVMQEVNSDESIAKIPDYLSVYIGYGELDPMCRKMKVLLEKYKKIQLRDVTVDVFEGMRHAILFEKSKKEVYLHILNWLNERTYL